MKKIKVSHNYKRYQIKKIIMRHIKNKRIIEDYLNSLYTNDVEEFILEHMDISCVLGTKSTDLNGLVDDFYSNKRKGDLEQH